MGYVSTSLVSCRNNSILYNAVSSVGSVVPYTIRSIIFFLLQFSKLVKVNFSMHQLPWSWSVTLGWTINLLVVV